MPFKPVEPITIPVRITFPDNTELWTTIDPTTQHHSCDQRLTCRQYVVEVTSSLICPLTPSVVQRPLPGSKLDISDYPTW